MLPPPPTFLGPPSQNSNTLAIVHVSALRKSAGQRPAPRGHEQVGVEETVYPVCDWRLQFHLKAQFWVGNLSDTQIV